MKAGSRRAAAPGVEVTQLDDDAQTELRNKNIGFVFQRIHLLPRLTAEENVMVPLLYRGVSEKEAREKAENALCIPLNAVTSSKGESKVTLQKDDGSTEEVTISTGIKNDAYIQITDGLSEGDTVVVPESEEDSSSQGGFGMPGGMQGESGREMQGGPGGDGGPPDRQQ